METASADVLHTGSTYQHLHMAVFLTPLGAVVLPCAATVPPGCPVAKPLMNTDQHALTDLLKAVPHPEAAPAPPYRAARIIPPIWG